jgi:enamine deaminase RidA (YjgF/YER057c/UK114 family)
LHKTAAAFTYWGEVRKARMKYLGDHRPASTAVYVSQLVDPDWLVEVEAVACCGNCAIGDARI